MDVITYSKSLITVLIIVLLQFSTN